jgi:hypothetical protein
MSVRRAHAARAGQVWITELREASCLQLGTDDAAFHQSIALARSAGAHGATIPASVPLELPTLWAFGKMHLLVCSTTMSRTADVLTACSASLNIWPTFTHLKLHDDQGGAAPAAAQ